MAGRSSALPSGTVCLCGFVVFLNHKKQFDSSLFFCLMDNGIDKLTLFHTVNLCKILTVTSVLGLVMKLGLQDTC